MTLTIERLRELAKGATLYGPAQLRRELGELLLKAEQLHLASNKDAATNIVERALCDFLWNAVNSLRMANTMAGQILHAQLTDADRAQAADAAGRA